MKIYFFDTETTGNTGHDYLCQLAIKEHGIDTAVINEMYKPPVSIPIECTMIHGISNKMVADKGSFKDAADYVSIKAIFESPDTICVAHNAAFDAQILRNDGVDPTNLICTFKVIRTLDSNGQFPMHKLQYLRYALDMELDVAAHEALADVLVLEKLFEYELLQAKEKWHMDEQAVLAEMMAITTQPITFRTFSFGKYKGKTIQEVAVSDRGYLEWLYGQKKQSEADETDWLHTLEKYLKA